jgi:O-acetylserine/cysteine efflux transporter
VPVFALISGYFMYDEVLSVAQVVASVLFLIGIGLIVKPATAGSSRTSGDREAERKLAKQS